jgi:hypothetical protein
MNTSLNGYRVALIPSWIYNSLIRNKFSLTDITNYNKLKSLLSVHDMSCLVKLNDGYELIKQEDPVFGYGLHNLFQNITNDEVSELYSKYNNCLVSSDIENTLETRLTDVNGMTDDSYRLVINEYTLIVVLPEGFKEKIKCPNYRLDFIKDVLKALYTISDMKTITASSISEYYVKCLYQRSKIS